MNGFPNIPSLPDKNSTSHDIIRYSEKATGRFIVGFDPCKNVMSAAAFAILVVDHLEKMETLRVLGYDCPYKQ